MNRDEFEQAYADKYTNGDVSLVVDNRDGEGYTDHHIDIWWKLYKIKSMKVEYDGWMDIVQAVNDLEM